jgi:hypothetical protein
MKESDMVTLFVSTAPHSIELQEVMGHIATLEQATRAVHEGYLGNPLYHQAAYTAWRLVALVEAMAWDEGTRIAHEIMCLFQTATTFGLVQALHLSELIAAFYRGMAQVSAGQIPYTERDARVMAPLLAIGLGTLSWLTAVVIMAALLLGGMLLLNALVQRYWQQEVSPPLDNVPTVPADLVAAQEVSHKARARAVRE